ncbi:hypothetical protein PGT21_003132 [Puccinia graminis f. sp. tritici]|uniref:Uncharacterized protein n=1 Tax=Puccinia graminis f. sp. tritici TaxID=56615 RepID=A0A5B0M672_PUCGR|nr:hypothetical protein PGT21_003132 [Puccinia graminis f. sp. tritici]
MLNPLLQQATPPAQESSTLPLGLLANRPLLPIASLLWEQCDRAVKCGPRPLFGRKSTPALLEML